MSTIKVANYPLPKTVMNPKQFKGGAFSKLTRDQGPEKKTTPYLTPGPTRYNAGDAKLKMVCPNSCGSGNPTFKGAPKTFLYRSALSGRGNLVGDEIGMETNSCSYTSTRETEYPYDSSLQFMEAQNNEWAVVSGMSVSTMIPAESAAPAPSEAGASSETPKDKKGNWCFPLLCCNGSSVAPKEPPS